MAKKKILKNHPRRNTITANGQSEKSSINLLNRSLVGYKISFADYMPIPDEES